MDQVQVKIPYLGELSSWVNIGWLVALLVGLWGVMIGIGKFGLSEIIFLLCGAIAIARLIYEAMTDRTRIRIIVCAVFFIAIIAIEYRTLQWTNGLGAEAEQQRKEAQDQKDKLSQLDKLPGQMQDLRNEQTVELAKEEQKISDIGTDNKELKGAIEAKDATLASIASKQYDLGFFPQVTVSAKDGTTDQVNIQNHGGTNVTVSEIDVEGLAQDANNVPALMPQGAGISFMLHEWVTSMIVGRTGLTGNADRLPIECTVHLISQNKKAYTLGFTWLFDVKDRAITKTYVIVRPLVEVTQQ